MYQNTGQTGPAQAELSMENELKTVENTSKSRVWGG